MISANAETDLRAIASIAHGMSKAYGGKQAAMMFDVLADRIDAVADEYGEAAWRRRVAESAATRRGAT